MRSRYDAARAWHHLKAIRGHSVDVCDRHRLSSARHLYPETSVRRDPDTVLSNIQHVSIPLTRSLRLDTVTTVTCTATCPSESPG